MRRRDFLPQPEAIGDWPDCDLCGERVDDPDLTWHEAWERHNDSEPLCCATCSKETP